VAAALLSDRLSMDLSAAPHLPRLMFRFTTVRRRSPSTPNGQCCLTEVVSATYSRRAPMPERRRRMEFASEMIAKKDA